MNIKNIHSRMIFDSRGVPTVETTVLLDDGKIGVSSVPSGASKSKSEALELRDGDPTKYNGMGVLRAVENVNSVISPKISGMDAFALGNIDQAMIEIDGTTNKEHLGANAMLSVSQAVIVAASKTASLPLYSYIQRLSGYEENLKIPVPLFNMIEGGAHGGSYLDFQEFLAVPASSKSYSEALDTGISVYRSVKKLMANRGYVTLVADEGGFSPNIGTNEATLSFLKEAIDSSGFAFSLDVFIGLDVAANSFSRGKTYKLTDRPTELDTGDLLSFYNDLFSQFSLIYIEDPFAEDDIEAWKKMYETLGDKTLIVGDDLVATNPYKLASAVESKLIGGVVIKPNQIGTITEALAVSEIARFKGIKMIVSHRSGETEDSFIADFAVGIGADYVKFGAPARERTVKYNRLLKIEEELAQI